MSDPNRSLRRCVCHKLPIQVERDENGTVVKRFCTADHPWKEIPKDQTYLSTYGSTEEYQPPDQPPVKRFDCPICGNNGVVFSISAGADGKTFTIWLECLSCGANSCFRSLAKLFEAAAK